MCEHACVRACVSSSLWVCVRAWMWDATAKVRRPLAAVSKITKAGNIAFFSEGCDYIIDKRDELALDILDLVQRVKLKTKMHEHKGTYRLRAWMIPEAAKESQGKSNAGRKEVRPFGRQGA